MMEVIRPECVTRRAQEQCAKWLAYCLRIGWDREQLDALENLWWQGHDAQGNSKQFDHPALESAADAVAIVGMIEALMRQHYQITITQGEVIVYVNVAKIAEDRSEMFDAPTLREALTRSALQRSRVCEAVEYLDQSADIDRARKNATSSCPSRTHCLISTRRNSGSISGMGSVGNEQGESTGSAIPVDRD